MSTDAKERPKKIARQQRLSGEGFPDVDQELEDAGDEYTKALRAKNKATEKFNTQKEMVLDLMERRGVDMMRVDNGSKILRLTTNRSLKLEKIKEVVGEPATDEDE